MISLLTLMVLSCLQLEAAGGQEEPFILPSGEHYRDLITVRTASLAAAFAKRFQSRVRSEARRRHRESVRDVTASEVTPVFLKTDTTTQLARRGRIMPDEDIFDFTDSRFLNPPPENIRNHPTVEVTEVDGRRFVTPSPPPPPAPHHSNPPRLRPTPQPIFQLPENFINDISAPRNPPYRKTIPTFVNFGEKTFQSYLSPSPTPAGYGQQIFRSSKYIKTLQPATKRKGPRKANKDHNKRRPERRLFAKECLSDHLPVRSLADSPFYLSTGAPYRDLRTVNTAKTVATLFLYGDNTVGSYRVERLGKRPRITPTFVATELYRAGQLRADSEIFDFTDSRFIRPPANTGRNFPTISLQEEILLGNTRPAAGLPNNEPYLGAGPLTIHHQSAPTYYQGFVVEERLSDPYRSLIQDDNFVGAEKPLESEALLYDPTETERPVGAFIHF